MLGGRASHLETSGQRTLTGYKQGVRGQGAGETEYPKTKTSRQNTAYLALDGEERGEVQAMAGQG